MKLAKFFLYFVNVSRKNLNFYILTLAYICFGLCACSDSDKTAGGGPSGTEAGNAITAQILASNSKPAAFAKVRLMDSESLNDSLAYVVQTDEAGYVSINAIANGKYTLEATLAKESIQKSVTILNASVDLGQNNLKEMATVVGTVGDSSAEGIVRARGLTHSANVSGGNFTLDSLPEGALSLVFLPNKVSDTICSYVKAVAGKSTIAKSFANERGKILLDDFNDLDSKHRYAPAYTQRGGWWFFSAESSVTVTYADSISKEIPLERTNNGAQIHFTVEFPKENRGFLWVNFGVQIGDKSDDSIPTYDLSSVDTVVFYAHGRGNFVMQLLDENFKGDSSVLAQAELNLNSEPFRYAIPLLDIVQNANALTHVNLLAFVFVDNAEFIFDDIEFIGADKHSIWKI